ncbi:hypothetical protein EJF36_10365 [Bacillus sp. HMF5848]|uniref:hypothetical protein n=1 Tax=Bacillus sp. HMF5848 TaxID=2495421 RepID=UPI000F783F4A|nr:hypothetical protein [Bacillus sp. HMF5848]RSK27251.1 hypothetical protein EJF36_10365 [Bacillus sp. HMF5848]
MNLIDINLFSEWIRNKQILEVKTTHNCITLLPAYFDEKSFKLFGYDRQRKFRSIDVSGTISVRPVKINGSFNHRSSLELSSTIYV